MTGGNHLVFNNSQPNSGAAANEANSTSANNSRDQNQSMQPQGAANLPNASLSSTAAGQLTQGRRNTSGDTPKNQSSFLVPSTTNKGNYSMQL